EAFVGQNISEMAGFSSEKKSERLKELIERYNSGWVDLVGSPNIRIVLD
ncbi:MAG: DUF4928 family protein, partial [Verrucomicrobiae bacterium]|nr:DUF4928 family protein [Verrucomicrobiae bacterium]